MNQEGVEVAALERLGPGEGAWQLVRAMESIADRAQLGGLYGTGLLLLALYETDTELAQAIDLLAGAPRQFERAASAFVGREAAKQQPRLASGRFSPNLWSVLEAAAAEREPDEPLQAAHLVRALLTHGGPARKGTNAWRILREADVDRSELLEMFQARPQVSGTRSDPRRALMAGFHSDHATGRASDDCLDLGATISAMANLIASPDLEGNLSLGVFGNWGSGKSFFMKRLQSAISELCDYARDEAEKDPAAPPAYWSNIVQVEFNVWHYIDANLWASLGAHLFERLRNFRRHEREGEVKSELERALQELSLAAAARDAAAKVEQAATTARDKAQQTLDEAKSSVASTAEQLAEVTARSLWSDVDDKLEATQIRQEIGRARRSVAALEHAVTEAEGSVKPLYEEIRDLTSTGGRLRVLMLKLLSEPGGAKVLVQAALLVALPVAALLVLGKLWNVDLERTGAGAASAITGAAFSIARIANWVRARSSEVLTAIEPLTKTRARIEAALNEAEQAKAKKLAELHKQLTIQAAALETAQREVSVREEQVQAAAASVSAAVTGSAISRFIEQRLASNEYQKALGLIAVIRRDFEQLSQLILGHNAQRRRLAEDAEHIEQQVKKALPHLEPAVLKRMFENLGVNRIVIYIDDLDRCPPKRVVEVLQAIHQLLAFPVFVVVVAVDVRWMQHSLALEYPSLLGPSAPKDGSPAGLGRVTPSDYLEKIFQIPFWVPALDVDATRSLLRKMTRQARRKLAPPPASQPTEQATTDTRSASLAPSVPTSSTSPSIPPTSGSVIPPSLLTRPEALALTDEERGAMSELALLIGRSPRAAKRFVNSYRLLKAALGAAGSGADLDGLTAPMLMLAVITGAPMLAPGFLVPPSTTTAGAPLTPLEHLSILARATTTDADVFDTFVRVRDFCAEPPSTRWGQLSFDDILGWTTRVSQFAFEDLTTPANTPLIHRTGVTARA
jgi:hypothetical protein